MRFYQMLKGLLIFSFFFFSHLAFSQTVIRGEVIDGTLAEPLIGANVIIKGTIVGTTSDYDGKYVLNTDSPLPIILEISYTGFETVEIKISDAIEPITTILSEGSFIIDAIEVRSSRILDKQKESPLTVESLDLIAIKETPAADFYDGLGALKDVDLTKASLGFTIVNTRGFNSTNPVRSLQIIDGVDNQSPGLNFSLGNFLGASELDINKVDLIVGASSAFYGPNAFNGVINMQTKDPFIHKGLAGSVKIGERALINGAFRYADDVPNKEGHPFMAYKINFQYFSANDWVADNFDPVFDTETGVDNPGGYDAVNIYGDEYSATNDLSDVISTPGLGIFHRRGYKEIELVDYDSENIKASGALHFRLNPAKSIESPELIFASSFGGGTTVYQGDNRFSLRNIKFFQHKIELKKRDTYFLRAYATHEDAGDSYDPYFTALLLQRKASQSNNWASAYINYWNISANPVIKGIEGIPKISDFIGRPNEYRAAISQFLMAPNVQDTLFKYHGLAQGVANSSNIIEETSDFFEPGTERFQQAFDDITQKLSFSEGGTKFFDKSALFHLHGEYKFKNVLRGNLDNNLDIIAGANGRIYMPNSMGSILLDTMGREINTYEFGIYTGGTYSFDQNRVKINGSLRVDKHENFDWLVSPAASLVYNPTKNNYLRFSFSSAIRNPTLTDQYLFYNVGRAILLGNIDGANDLITVESFVDYLNTRDQELLRYFDVPAIQPEKVKTFELGYRTTLFQRLYIDAGGYLSFYKDFIGYQIGVRADFDTFVGVPRNVLAYRVAANAKDRVTTQGVSIGLNFFLTDKIALAGNYSYNRLITETDDPIIPAFNTPKNKYNLGVSGRDMMLDLGAFKVPHFGFNINYKWIESFIFEGSPQFTGLIPSYDLLDAQINWRAKSIHTTFKLGASNVLNNKQFQTYGGPRVGRLAYFSITYDWQNK